MILKKERRYVLHDELQTYAYWFHESFIPGIAFICEEVVEVGEDIAYDIKPQEIQLVYVIAGMLTKICEQMKEDVFQRGEALWLQGGDTNSCVMKNAGREPLRLLHICMKKQGWNQVLHHVHEYAWNQSVNQWLSLTTTSDPIQIQICMLSNHQPLHVAAKKQQMKYILCLDGEAKLQHMTMIMHDAVISDEACAIAANPIAHMVLISWDMNNE